MREERYRRALLCRLCQGPILDRGVTLLAKWRMDKLRRWWKAHFGTEFAKATCPVCYFCVWDLRFADENSMEKEPLDQRWWPPYKHNLKTSSAINYKFYTEELMKPCFVKILPIATERVLEDTQQSAGQSYQCVCCPKVFSAFTSLKTHLQNHHRGQVTRCRFVLCRKYFQTEEEKVEHLKKEHAPKTYFNCFYCGKVSYNKNTHISHLQMKHKGQVIRCKYFYCSLMFKTEEERDQHFQEKHSFGKYFCCFCEIYLDNSTSQRNHVQNYHKDALRCNASQVCPNYFKTEEDRQKHVQEKHPNYFKKSVNCIYCKRTFLERKQLGAHVKRVHKDAIKCEFIYCCTFFETEEERQKHKEEVHEKNKFFCIYCDKTFGTKSGHFFLHLKTHHSEEEIIRCDAMKCVTYFKSEEEKLAHTKELHQSLDDNIICIYCNKFVPKIPSCIIYHMRRNHSDVSIKCTYHCSTYFKTLEEREKHIKEVHEAEKIQEPFPCLYCDKISADSTSFRKHVKLKHLDVAIKCQFPICAQFFKSKADLEKHFEQNPKHKKQKCAGPKETFSCLLCAKVFCTKGGLASHKQIVHEGIRKKCPYCQKAISNKRHFKSVFCQICKKKFMCPELLRIHSLACKPNRQCPVCAKIFKHNCELIGHCTRIHTAHIQQWRGLKYKSRGFHCDKCFIYFKHRCELNLHLKNEAHVIFKLTCNFCKKKYANRNSLQKHISRKHF